MPEDINKRPVRNYVDKGLEVKKQPPQAPKPVKDNNVHRLPKVFVDGSNG